MKSHASFLNIVEDTTCRECQYEGESGKDLNAHMITHKMLTCDKCDFSTRVSMEMPLHMKVHDTIVVDLSGEESVANKPEVIVHAEICPFCKLESKDLDALRTHIENIHGIGANNPQSVQNDEIIRESTETFTKCHHCVFIGNCNDMNNHIIKTNGSVAICGVCGYTFMDVQECEKHLKQAHPETEPFQCDECAETFVRPYENPSRR